MRERKFGGSFANGIWHGLSNFKISLIFLASAISGSSYISSYTAGPWETTTPVSAPPTSLVNCPRVDSLLPLLDLPELEPERELRLDAPFPSVLLAEKVQSTLS